ncbi:MAG: DNA cytosine methyltransferase [Opitutales bacterium]|nr:DNA cytosine methyltransferase [Opitutales bacterium]
MEGLNFIDLFCGVGGFRQALSSLGNTCVFSSDLDKDARETYQTNYGELPAGDITKIEADEIPTHDVLCGGFPCQPFSISGKMNGFGDARGTLLYEILRIARIHRPKVLFLENVKNYQSHADGRTMETTLKLLAEAGYRTYHQVLNASAYGIPQKRERLYFVCFRDDLGVEKFHFPEPEISDVSVEDILLPEGDRSLENLFIEREDLRLNEQLGLKRESRPIRIGTVGKGGQGERVYSSMGHAITLSAFGGGIGAKTGMYLIGKQIRRLHPRECARLMGFPESFVLNESRNICYKQFGNSVAIPVVQKIFAEVQKYLSGTQLQAA